MNLIHFKSRSITFPCGNCPECITKKLSSWAFRLMQEEKKSTFAKFITLTYDNKYVPFNPFGVLSLKKRDLQLFFKRLRKRLENNESEYSRPVKYYGVGEYGGETNRPHYHIALFNASIESVIDSWQLGNVNFGDQRGICQQTAYYMCKYMMKSKIKKKEYKQKWIEPEFSLISKGLGLSYLENQQMVDWHMTDIENRMYLGLKGGNKIGMPRYYKEKMYLPLEKAAISEVHRILQVDKLLEKLKDQTTTTVRNQKEAIKVAYKKMYSSSLKEII